MQKKAIRQREFLVIVKKSRMAVGSFVRYSESKEVIFLEAYVAEK